MSSMHRRAISGTAILLMSIAAGCGTVAEDVRELGEIFTPTTPGEAGRWVFDNNPDLRRKGVVMISNSPFGGVDVYLRAYRDIIQNDTDPVVRAAAVRALARHGAVSDGPLLAAQLTDENLHVRFESARGLQRVHNPEVIGRLIGRLSDVEEDARVRAAAATALGQYPEDFVFQSLLGALDARELSVNVAAHESLHTLTGETIGRDPGDWLTWYDGDPEPFANQQDYYFPTYRRGKTWAEKIAFWTEPSFESPAQPIGLRPASARSTYDGTGAGGDGVSGGGGDGVSGGDGENQGETNASGESGDSDR